jgi:NTE family protein
MRLLIFAKRDHGKATNIFTGPVKAQILIPRPMASELSAPQSAILALIFLLLFESVGAAQERPKIGLALSGGGAKGFAHVGVLKVLEEAGLPVDMICGTSMGAFIGGMYAIGYRAPDLENLILQTNWDDYLNDRVARRSLAMEQKLWDGRYIVELPIRQGDVKLPSGLISGQKITRLFSRLTLPVHHIQDFRDFPIPFACVATDIVSGESVRLEDGYLPEALLASMAFPTVFSPVRIGGRLLLDGGLVRNLPAEDVRDLGADIIIGVDVSAPLLTEDELQSFFDILDQAVSFMSVSSTMRQRRLCDILIQPDVNRQPVFDFSHPDSLIAAGEKAAREFFPQLRALADSLRSISDYSKPAALTTAEAFYIEEITIEGLNRVSRDFVLSLLEIHPPAQIAMPDLEKAVARISSTQVFERIFYKLEPGDNATRLKIKVVEKSEQLLRFGFRYDSGTEAAVLLNGFFRNPVKSNSVLSVDLKLGQQVYFDSQYFFTTGLRPRIGLRSRVRFDDDFLDLFFGDQRVASLNIQSVFGEVFFGTIFSNSLAMGLGARIEYSDRSFRIGPVDLPSENSRMLPFYFQLWADTQNRVDFPSRGVSLVFRHEAGHNRFLSDFTFTRHYFDFRFALPVHRRFSILGEALLTTAFGDSLPPQYQFTLGGLNTPVLFFEKDLSRVSFVGLKPQELLGEHLQFYQLGLQYEFLPRIFLQFCANAGNRFDSRRPDFWNKTFLYGAGFTVGATTPIGPVEFTVMSGSRHDLLTHLNIGYRF